MAATKKSSKKKDSDQGLDQSVESFRASLEHSVTVSRDRLQEVLDDAVERGRMTRRDAENLVSELLDRGRKQRGMLLDELERVMKHLTGKPRGKSFPISGYDDLNASEVKTRLGALSPAELRTVRKHEQAGQARKTVLSAIDKKLKD
ncbi:MAG TPA: hypothetical protein VFD37_01165 [Solirubrobacterales bacterium]|nr:hypothetical protein [Solirubrobacterales bacterium]